ncbi:Protein of unknown function [Modicisalibacter xianhensis]|uniref:DUF1826 domain-containing protein n=2 Tax=Modicisalibacter xianhensis TaxID=442341 RepID=A0A1I3DNZ0_9GAMM|nr:Protein of unknown function [Halomonas xianhensis]
MPMPALSHSLNDDNGRHGAPHWAVGDEVEVLPRIFDDAINIAVMRRTLDTSLVADIEAQCATQRAWQLAWLGHPDNGLREDLLRQLPAPDAAAALAEDILLLAQAVCDLFDTSMVGVRLRLLDAAMCPRFHCDNLPVRLITTYYGPGSEWLPETAVNRAGLGAPNAEKPEPVIDPDAIQRLTAGDIGLLKGSGWIGNEHRGLVHRSPVLQKGQKRLLLTMDPG